MNNERDAIEARALLSNAYLMKVLDEMEANTIARVAACSSGNADELRTAALRLKVVREFKSTLTMTSKKDQSHGDAA